jgi:hypothetical protein
MKGIDMATQLAPNKGDDARILSSAVAKIAEFWGLSNAKLGLVLGLSQATVSRLRSGQTTLDPASKSFEAGQFLLRLFRGLDALMGSDDAASRRWLETPISISMHVRSTSSTASRASLPCAIMWTPTALASELGSYRGAVWRVVEAQHRISTNRLADSLEDQARLEALAEAAKPDLPKEAQGLHYLLASPFRYGHGTVSRFRRAE